MRKQARWKTALLWLIFLIPVLIYNACGEFTANPKSVQEEVLASLSCEDKLAWAFQMGPHTFLSKTCNACHYSGGPAPGNFADRNVAVALSDFVGLGYGTTPTKWELIIRNATDNAVNHQGKGGEHNIPAFQPGRDLWELALDQYNAQCGGGLGGGYLTEAVLWVTQTAPNTNEERVIPLDNLSGDLSIPGGELKFTTSYQIEGVPLTYKLTNLRMKNGDRRVRVKSLSIYHNGVLATTATSFTQVDRTLEPGEELPLLTVANPSPMFFEGPAGSDITTDEISFHFELIEFL